MADSEAQDLLRRFQVDETIWQQWVPLWQDAYKYALPNRMDFYQVAEAQRRTQEIYDETAVVGTQELASKIGSILMPAFMRWSNLRAGPEIADPDMVAQVNQALEVVTEFVFSVINGSNFHQAMSEAMLDGVVSTGSLVIEDDPGDDIIRCAAVPLTDLVLGRGAFGAICAWYRRRRLKGRSVLAEYPRAFPNATQMKLWADKPDDFFDFLEITTCTDEANELYQWRVIDRAQNTVLARADFAGLGSNPWVSFRWSVGPNETYGRGPVLNALSAIKTCNLTVELILANAEIAVTGVYQYDHDGVMNPDTVQLVPGTFIPRAPNSKGLEPIKSGADFNVAELVLNDQRTNIKRALYVNEFAPLDKTPQSATEIVARQQDLAQRLGSSYGRLSVELVNAAVVRVVYLLRRRGLIRIPRVDGRLIAIHPISPLAKAQNSDDILGINRFLENLQQAYGPQMVALVTKPEETAAKLAELYAVPPSLVRTPREVQGMAQQMAAAAQAQAQAQAAGPGAGGGAGAPSDTSQPPAANAA